MEFIWREYSGCIDRVVVCQHGAGEKKNVAIILAVIHDHFQHLSHDVVDSIDTAIILRVVRTRCNLAGIFTPIEDSRETNPKLLTIVGEKRFRVTITLKVVVSKDVGYAAAGKSPAVTAYCT